MEPSTRFDEVLDARGLACPMPIVKARLAMNKMQPGDVLQVLSTDRGSIKDFEGWARSSQGVKLIKQETTTEGGQTIYTHYVEKLS